MQRREKKKLHSAGYSKDEILKIAGRLAGEIIDVEVEEDENIFSIKLSWKQKLLPNGSTSYTLFKIEPEGEKKIEQFVKDYVTDLVDSLIQKFDLEQHYNKMYAQTDTNVLYTVKRTYQTNVGDINYGEDFFLLKARILRELLPAYEPLLSMLLYHVTEQDNEQELKEYMIAIAERFDQLFFAHKIISEIISSGKTDPSIQFVFGFHLYHFISLVKTLGDNLAWILMFYLNLQFQNPQDIDLLSKGFRNKVTNANSRLASLIYDNVSELSKFESLKDYRDIIQHRHKLHIYTQMAGEPSRRKIVIPANPESLVQGNKLRQNKLIPSNNHDIDAIRKELPSNIEINFYEAPSDELEDIDHLEFCKENVDYILNVYKRVLDRIYPRTYKEANRLSRQLL